MDMQAMLDQRNITRYHLSQISGVPKTTITDICAGKSSIERCSAKTVWMLSKALGCPMEDLMMLGKQDEYKSQDGLPADRSYLECGLPLYLSESVQRMKEAWDKKKRGIPYLRFDCDYCELQSNINCAEVNQEISADQAWYLRTEYLGIERM